MLLGQTTLSWQFSKICSHIFRGDVNRYTRRGQIWWTLTVENLTKYLLVYRTKKLWLRLARLYPNFLPLGRWRPKFPERCQPFDLWMCVKFVPDRNVFFSPKYDCMKACMAFSLKWDGVDNKPTARVRQVNTESVLSRWNMLQTTSTEWIQINYLLSEKLQ